MYILRLFLIVSPFLILQSCGEKGDQVRKDIGTGVAKVGKPVADFVAEKGDINFNHFSGWVSADILKKQRAEQEAFAEKLNTLRAGTPYAYLELEDLLQKTPPEEKELLDAAAGFYNHGVFFNSIEPGGAQEPIGFINAGMGAEFGGYRWFKKNLLEMAQNMDGEGWIFLLTDKEGTRMWLSPTGPNETPLMEQVVSDFGYPIAALDLTKGSYTGSLENYINGFIKRINWTNVENNLIKFRPKS